jgi:hypothetical protein
MRVMYVCTSCRANADKKAETAQQGSIDNILKGMIANQGDAVVQEQGCAALANLGVNADNMVEIAKQGGIAAIIKGMFANQDHVGVQAQGCAALTVIGWSQRDLQERIKGEGAVEVVKRAMALSNFPAQTKKMGQHLLDQLSLIDLI